MNIVEPYIAPVGFEQVYLALRHEENRVYSDDEVLYLPEILSDHPHFLEWQLRKESFRRLKNYLIKNQLLTILEVGCGNGWLCHRMASIPGSKVTGIDINTVELHQAQRVFNHLPSIHFIPVHINDKVLDNKFFDVIIFAASLQYFSSLPDLLEQACKRLRKSGEIHIIDTPFYSPEEVGPAKKRSLAHFTILGFPGMSDYYFHHTMESLAEWHFKTLYQPSLVNKYLLKSISPFPWICIRPFFYNE